MKRILITVIFGLAAFVLAAGPAQAQNDDTGRVTEMLRASMSRQAPLTEEDVRTYLSHAEAIYMLRYEPEKTAQVVSETGWTENRFAYVSTKVAVGMSLLVRRDDPRNASIPDFARPAGAELSLLRSYQDDLVKAMEAAQARRSGGADSPASD